MNARELGEQTAGVMVVPDPAIFYERGLTKREAFAVAALPQCIDVAMDFLMCQDGDDPINEVMMSEVMQRAAGFARAAADALLEELAK